LVAVLVAALGFSQIGGRAAAACESAFGPGEALRLSGRLEESTLMKTKQQFLMIVGLAILMMGSASSFAANGAAGAASSPAGSSASVVGKVKFTGQLPQPTKVSMNADPSCAKLHPAPAVSQEFLTGSDNALGNVVVFISQGLENRSFDVPAESVSFEQKGCEYAPHVVALRANQKLKMINSDNTTHNIHPLPANNREWNKAEPAGSTMEESFPREEIAIPVKCNVHPWMKSYVAVFKHPYFAVTGKDGSFQLPNLPPGEYTVEAWHEKLGTMTQKITVTAGQTASLNFTFKAH
jgi:plastocyanin